MTWLARFRNPAVNAARLGPLEWRVLETLWSRETPASVRDLQPEFSEIAYTTLMTTLDRLFRKGVLGRSKQGRAFFYVPRLTRQEFESGRAEYAAQVVLYVEAIEKATNSTARGIRFQELPIARLQARREPVSSGYNFPR